MNAKETVTIPKKEYDELLDDSHLLNCLRAVGVDNWQGWDDAIDMYNNKDEECE